VPERKSIQQVFDDCYIQHRMEIATKGKSLALYVTIPKALNENDYDITRFDGNEMADLSDLILERISSQTVETNPTQVVVDIICEMQNKGLLVRRREDYRG
jgi:hypothetical protein